MAVAYVSATTSARLRHRATTSRVPVHVRSSTHLSHPTLVHVHNSDVRVQCCTPHVHKDDVSALVTGTSEHETLRVIATCELQTTRMNTTVQNLIHKKKQHIELRSQTQHISWRFDVYLQVFMLKSKTTIMLSRWHAATQTITWSVIKRLTASRRNQATSRPNEINCSRRLRVCSQLWVHIQSVPFYWTWLCT